MMPHVKMEHRLTASQGLPRVTRRPRVVRVFDLRLGTRRYTVVYARALHGQSDVGGERVVKQR